MTTLACRAALLLGLLCVAACASAPPPPAADFAAPAPRHADVKTTLENHY